MMESNACLSKSFPASTCSRCHCTSLVLLLGLLLPPAGLAAGVYKCIDATGGVIFSDRPCPTTAVGAKSARPKTSVKVLEGHEQPVSAVAMSSRRLVSGSASGAIRVWSGRTGELLKTIKTGAPVQALAVADGKIIAALAGSPPAANLAMWGLVTGKLLKKLQGHDGSVEAVSIAEELIASAGADNTVRIWSLRSGQLLKTLRIESAQANPAADSGMHFVALTNGRVIGANETAFAIWDVATRRLLQTVETPGQISALAAADGRIATGFNDRNDIVVWNLANGEPVLYLLGHRNGVRTLVFDNHRLISGAQDGTIKIWSMTDGQLLHTLNGHEDAVLAVSFADDTLISGSRDKTVRMWTGY